MDLNFYTDSLLAPKPRNEVKIESLLGRPYPDGRRVQVELHITPFLPSDRPNILVTLLDSNDAILTSTHVIETIRDIIHITLHLPQGFDKKAVTLRADLYYDQDVFQAEVTQEILLDSAD